MVKVLIIGGDSTSVVMEVEYLEILDYEVTVCCNAIDGLEEALTGKYDLIMMGIDLPGINGFQLCKKLRDKLAIPILIVSEKIHEDDEVKSLSVGADDYIQKPFLPAAFIARVKANLAEYNRISHMQLLQEEILTAGDLRLYTDSHRVFVGENEVFLKNKEYELLLFMMKNRDIVFSKETLYEKIWGFDAVGDNATVAVHINRLREKLEADPSSPKYIQTVWGAGYRFAISL